MTVDNETGMSCRKRVSGGVSMKVSLAECGDAVGLSVQLGVGLQDKARMGIQGLLKLLDQLTLREHLSTFQGKTAAIDVMSWIYKGCYRCAFELNQNIESNNFLYYIFEMLDLLEHYHIKPICVFDGRYVGKKDETIDKRKKTKEENRLRGLEYLKIGNEEEARKYLSRCIIIDDRIITTTMRAFRGRKVDFMVAPYESDSQIAKLFHLGLADFAISEDSDLIIYGIKVVMKLVQDGDCNYVDLSLWQPFDADSFFLKQFLKLDHTSRVEAAVLSGTDYNTSIKGIGIKKAVKHLGRLGSMNAVIDYLREVKPFSERIPQNYERIVLQSKLIFLLATVYNPLTKSLEYLNPSRLQELQPPGMSEEQLQQIIGVRYEYTESVNQGKISARTLETRDITELDIIPSNTINVINLQVKEVENVDRRALQKEAKLRRDENVRMLIASGLYDKKEAPSKTKKKKLPPVELTQEEKKQQAERRKQEKLKNFNEFKQMLSNVMITAKSEQSESEQESQESESEGEMEIPPQSQGQTLTQPSSSSKTIAKNKVEQQSYDSDSCSESIELCLQSLNPWSNIALL